MKEEKIGGYDTRLNRRHQQYRENIQEYESGWGEGQKGARPEEVEFVNKILESIDREQLKDVFLDELRRSGVRVEDANTEALNQIFLRPFDHAAAMYNILLNTIQISVKSKEIAEKELSSGAVPESIVKEMQLLFIHEACHAFSRNRLRSLGKTTGKMSVESGYSTAEANPLKSGKANKTLEAFNEGVTQRIAEEVFLEYSKRMGNPADEFLSEALNRHQENFWNYYIFGNQVDQMCEHIARYVGVPKDTVWESVKRGYFERPELFNEETVELFAQTFGEDFLEEYSKFNVKTSIKTLARFDKVHGFTHPHEYAERWKQHLGIPDKV